MRNKYQGNCYVCGKRVEAGQGHFERKKVGPIGWQVQCAEHPLEKKAAAGSTSAERKLESIRRMNKERFEQMGGKECRACECEITIDGCGCNPPGA